MIWEKKQVEAHYVNMIFWRRRASGRQHVNMISEKSKWEGKTTGTD
jgi:hypothetical protein